MLMLELTTKTFNNKIQVKIMAMMNRICLKSKLLDYNLTTELIYKKKY